MARLYNRWYLYPADICRICDLTEHSVAVLAQRGDLVANDLISLLTFCAEHLTPQYRKKLQQDVTESQAQLPIAKLPGGSPMTTQVPDDLPPLHWCINSQSIVDSLGISQNSVHTAISRGYFEPGNILSLLRFALWSARPDRRAPLHAALFAEVVITPPKPRMKRDERL